MGTNTLILAKGDKASYFVALSPLARAWCDERRMSLVDCHRFHAHKETSEALFALLTRGEKRDARTLDAVKEYMSAIHSSEPRVSKRK